MYNLQQVPSSLDFTEKIDQQIMKAEVVADSARENGKNQMNQRLTEKKTKTDTRESKKRRTFDRRKVKRQLNIRRPDSDSEDNQLYRL